MTKPAVSLKRFLPVAAFVLGFLALGFVTFAYVLPHGRGPAGPAIGGPFALETPDGRVVTDKDLAGKPYLLFFGYTHCPDICPAALADLTALYKALGPNAEKINTLFVSVDPERDKGEALKEYLSSFDPHIIGLSGTLDQTKAMEAAFRVYAKKVFDKDGSYTMDHIAITYLMDKTGHFVGAFDLDRPAKDAAVGLTPYF